VRLLQRTAVSSLLASRCEYEQTTSERLQAVTPWKPGVDSSEPVLLRAEVPRAGGSRPAYLPRLGMGGRQSDVSTPKAPSVPQHTL
jgi:hypothetical protein